MVNPRICLPRRLTCFALVGMLALPVSRARRGSQSRCRSRACRRRCRRATAWWWRRRRARRVSASTFCKRAAMRWMPRSRSVLRLPSSYPRAGNIGGGGFMVIHRANGERHRDRLSRDRAGGDRRQELSRRAGQCRSAEVARIRARHRRAGHRRRSGAGRGEIRLRPFHACRSDRARDRHGARRHHARPTTLPMRCPMIRRGSRAGRRRRKSFSKPTAVRCRPAIAWCKAISRIRLKPSRATARARSTRGRSPKKSPPRCRPPAA